MKKTVSITISGIIFNIEEDGYDVLRRYLDTISGYFTQSDGKDEIMADIEARIAELFQERMDDRKMVITAEDVEEVINVMGRPEEYVGEDTEFGSSTAGEGCRRRGSRRVYRDMEGNLIGGVCSGIAHYFGWDPLWIRLIWALLAIGFGFGFLLYIILWIIIPEAKSTSEKLEMTGEAVNVENIKKKVSETFERVKDVDTGFQRSYAARQVGRFFDLLGQIILGLFRFLGKVIGVILLVLSLVFVIGLLYGLIDGSVFTIGGEVPLMDIADIPEAFFTNALHGYMAYTGLGLVLIMPVVLFILLGTRLLFGVPTKGKAIFGTVFALLVIGGVILGISAIGMAKEFNERDYLMQENDLSVESDTLYVQLADEQLFSGRNSIYHDAGEFRPELVMVEGDSIFFGYPELRIEQNVKGESFSLEVERSGTGYTRTAALERAEGIQYRAVEDDERLVLSTFFSAALLHKVRGQECTVTLKVPKGKVIYLDGDITRILGEAHNRHNLRLKDLADEHWIMTDDGLAKPEDEDVEPASYAL